MYQMTMKRPLKIAVLMKIKVLKLEKAALGHFLWDNQSDFEYCVSFRFIRLGKNGLPILLADCVLWHK